MAVAAALEHVEHVGAHPLRHALAVGVQARGIGQRQIAVKPQRKQQLAWWIEPDRRRDHLQQEVEQDADSQRRERQDKHRLGQLAGELRGPKSHDGHEQQPGCVHQGQVEPGDF